MSELNSGIDPRIHRERDLAPVDGAGERRLAVALQRDHGALDRVARIESPRGVEGRQRLALLPAEVALEAELRAEAPVVGVEANAGRGVGAVDADAEADGRVPGIVLRCGSQGRGKEAGGHCKACFHSSVVWVVEVPE
jgi:hypothetical protein